MFTDAWKKNQWTHLNEHSLELGQLNHQNCSTCVTPLQAIIPPPFYQYVGKTDSKGVEVETELVKNTKAAKIKFLRMIIFRCFTVS